jgi:hypothetical protein
MMEGNDRFVMISGIVVLIVILGSALALGANNDLSEPPPWKPPTYFGELMTETISEGGEAQLGETYTVEIPLSDYNPDGGTRIIRNITATLTWVDETDKPGMRLRRFENQPDTFSLSLECPHGNATDVSGSNPQNGEGRLDLMESHTNEELNSELGTILSTGNSTFGTWKVDITMTEGGMWIPVLPPRLLGYNDESNVYVLTVFVEFYDISDLIERE